MINLKIMKNTLLTILGNLLCLLIFENINAQADCTTVPNYNRNQHANLACNSSEVYPDGESGYCLTGKEQRAFVAEVQNCAVQLPLWIDPISYEMRLRHDINPFTLQIEDGTQYSCVGYDQIANTSDLIISEVVTDNNYADEVCCIEIYNGKGATVNLSNYSLDIYLNGTSTPSYNIPLNQSGITSLNHNKTIVICTYDDYFKGYANRADIDLSATHDFFAKETFVLMKGNDTLDIFGNIGCELPYNKWWFANDDGNPSYYSTDEFTTRGKSVFRSKNYVDGVTSDEDGCGFLMNRTNYTGSYAWETLPTVNSANMSSLGYHPESVDYLDPHAHQVILQLGSIYTGIAPRSNIVTDRGSSFLMERFLKAGMPNDVFVSSHSWGTAGPSCDSGTVEDKTVTTETRNRLGAYVTASKEFDEWLFEKPEHLMCKAAGNMAACYGTGTEDMIDYGAGTCKNALTIGASSGYTGQNISYASSRGPTDDLRVKPDLVASYHYINPYTSFSTPKVSGAALLLHEQWDNFVSSPHPYNINPYSGSSYPLAATMKGLLIHTASPCGSNYDVPNYECGWGLLNVEPAADIIAENSQKAYRNIQELTYSNHDLYIAVKANGLEDLKATMCWTDVPGTPVNIDLLPQGVGNPIASPALVNDLDIEIIEVANNSTTYPWTFNVSDPTGPPVRAIDNVNNVEKVVVDQSNINTNAAYLIKISAKNPMEGWGTSNDFATQNFSLIISGASEISNARVDFLTADCSTITTLEHDVDTLISTNTNYFADDCITTSQEINNDAVVLYSSEGKVLLNPGFETELGVTMCATIHDCTSSKSTEGEGQSISESIDTEIQIYPNPFSEKTNIQINLIEDSFINISIYDLQGKKIRTLVDEKKVSKGICQYSINADELPQGTYLCKIQTKSGTQTKKIMVVR